MNAVPKTCIDCRYVRRVIGFDRMHGSVRCTHPQVVRKDPAALASASNLGSSALAERANDKGAACGIRGHLWEPAAATTPAPDPSDNTLRAERDRLRERIDRLRALCRCAADWLIEAGQTDRAEMLLDMSRQLDPHHD